MALVDRSAWPLAAAESQDDLPVCTDSCADTVANLSVANGSGCSRCLASGFSRVSG
jgi:hypothetical protein